MEETVEIQARTLEVLNDQGKQMNAIRGDFDKVRVLSQRDDSPCCQLDVTSTDLAGASCMVSRCHKLSIALPTKLT